MSLSGSNNKPGSRALGRGKTRGYGSGKKKKDSPKGPTTSAKQRPSRRRRAALLIELDSEKPIPRF